MFPNLTNKFCKGFVRLITNYKADNYEWTLLEMKHGDSYAMYRSYRKKETTFFLSTETQKGIGRNK